MASNCLPNLFSTQTLTHLPYPTILSRSDFHFFLHLRASCDPHCWPLYMLLAPFASTHIHIHPLQICHPLISHSTLHWLKLYLLCNSIIIYLLHLSNISQCGPSDLPSEHIHETWPWRTEALSLSQGVRPSIYIFHKLSKKICVYCHWNITASKCML